MEPSPMNVCRAGSTYQYRHFVRHSIVKAECKRILHSLTGKSNRMKREQRANCDSPGGELAGHLVHGEARILPHTQSESRNTKETAFDRNSLTDGG